MHLFESSNWTRRSQASRVALGPSVMLESFPLLAQAQGKEAPVGHLTPFRRTQLDGISIFCRAAGPQDAPTLLLLHGVFLNQPGQVDIQTDLFYDYRTNVDAYPKWQAWLRAKQPRLLGIWGKDESSFDPSEPGQMAAISLDIAADEIAAVVRDFMKTQN